MRQLATSERGVTVVFICFFLPALVIMLTLAIDVGNWLEHKRHLQAQADAAALAGADAYVLPSCSNAAITSQVNAYGGATYNAQVGSGQSRVHTLINQRSFYGQSATDPTPNSEANTSSPCADKAVDVKLTETDVPAFFGLIGAPFINAHARVSIRAKDTTTGALPIAVPDPNAKSAKAYFVDESTNRVIASASLQKAGTSNGLQLWDNASAPVSVPVTTGDIGVRIALGGGSSTTCGASLVLCYDATSTNGTGKGFAHIRGWSSAGSGAQPAAPLARDVSLVPVTCADPYFSAAGTSCSYGLSAKVDFGTSGGKPVNPVSADGATVTATAGGTTLNLAYDPTSDRWTTGASTFSLAPNTGATTDVTMDWTETKGKQGGNTCKTGNGNKCTGTFGKVQRAFSASNAQSGPLQLVQVGENGTYLTNSFQQCASTCAHNLTVRIGTSGSLGLAASASDPVVSLRVVGNQNQALDCDPALSNLASELATGCSPTYAVNTGQTCPSSVRGTQQPWNCVDLQTGHATNQVAEGLNQRILGDTKPNTCTAPNHWSSFPNLPKGDPRIVQVFTTPYGSFDSTGSGSVPVTGFATFYVTGWTGQGGGFNNPCQGNGDDTPPGPGTIVGHFIKYVDSLNSGGASQAPCDLTALAPCVAVMTD